MNTEANFSEMPPLPKLNTVRVPSHGEVSEVIPFNPEADALHPEVAKINKAKRSGLLILPGASVTITEAADNIFSQIALTKNLFYRGGRVNEVVKDTDGTSRLEPLVPSQFRSRIEGYGTCVAWRSPDGEPVLKPTNCPEETAKALMDSLPARKLPNISLLSACPVFARGAGNSFEVLGPGWHAANGGVFVTGGETPPAVPLGEAIAALSDIVADFNFTTPGDRSRALASLIAPALKSGGWLKNLLPIDVGEADQSQSGKTYRQKLVAAIYRDQPNLIAQRAHGVGSMDESISQALIDARPFVLLDNLRGTLDSQILEAILTAPGDVKARVPHKAEVKCDARNYVWQLTSNGVETTRDLANRSSIIRIKKQDKGFAFKTYAEGDIFDHVKANQPYYLGCVFALIQEWCANDNPRTAETGHSFREWATTLDWFTQNIFKSGPLMDGHEAASARVCDPKRNWIRHLALALKTAGRLGEKFYATPLAEFACDNDCPPPGVPDHADERLVGRKIGGIFSTLMGQSESSVYVEGFLVTREQHYSTEKGRYESTYIFSEVQAA